MNTSHLPSTCCALLQSKGTRCTAPSKEGSNLCGTHLRCKKVICYNESTNTNNIHLNASLNNTHNLDSNLSKNLCQLNDNSATVILPIQYRSGLKYHKVKTTDLKKTLNYYNLNSEGPKKKLFDRLAVHYDSLLPFIKHINYILYIQTWFKKQITIKLNNLQTYFNYSINKCVNDSDVLTLERLDSLDKNRIFTYKDTDNFIYGYDIYSISKLLEQSNRNPYTGKAIDEITILKITKLLHYLSLTGYTLANQSDGDSSNQIAENPKHLVKRRVIKVFQEMDQLDQYTNPTWFLDLNVNSLYRFYKEAEDIWNYRLNLTKETKGRIVPPDGKVFNVEPKHVLKDYPTLTKLRNVCLDVMEKLIYSAEDRSDRVNGCIYILLALVIVNKEAALAMPSYYTMVTGDIINANYIEIVI